MARLDLYLSGPFEARLGGVPVTAFHSDKVRALLAYLAVEAGCPRRRESLAGLLWPDYPERSSRISLSNALSHLRTALRDRGACGVDRAHTPLMRNLASSGHRAAALAQYLACQRAPTPG